jgi:GTPase-associated adaptor domain
LDRESTIDSQKSVTMPDSFPLILLRFFRDLSPTQRLAVLVELKALPDEWRDPLTHSVERQVVDSLAKRGRLAELDAAINKIMSQSGGTQGK